MGRKSIAVYLAVLCALSALHLFTGLADNGDFSRTFGFLIQKPLGWAADLPDPNGPDWARRFFYVWHDRWSLYQGLGNVTNLFSFSTEKLYLVAQVLFSAALTGQVDSYSVIVGSLIGRVVLLASVYATFVILRSRASVFAAWAWLVCATPIVLSSSFIAFLNSFYEEQIAIILLPALGAVLLLIALTGRERYGWAALALSLFVALSKTAYFPLPLIAAPWMFKSFRRRMPWWKFAAMPLLATAVAFLPARFGENKGVNQYHALYFGALMAASDRGLTNVAEVNGKPVFNECVAVNGFSVVGIKCIDKARVTYRDTASFVVHHPSIAVAMMARALHTGLTVRIQNLGMQLENCPVLLANIPLFSLWDRLFSLYGNGLAFALGTLTACALIFRKSMPGALRVSLFFACWGFVQYMLALGDGYHELGKHLIGGNFALSLFFPFFIAGALGFRKRAVGA